MMFSAKLKPVNYYLLNAQIPSSVRGKVYSLLKNDTTESILPVKRRISAEIVSPWV